MKAINMKLEDMYHEDLEVVREHYSQLGGVKLSKSQALKRLLHESANVINNTGKLWSWEGNDADWEE